MLARPALHPASLGEGPWVFEPKLDGLRCIAVRDGTRAALWSRNHQPLGTRFARIAAALGTLGVDDFTLDGEVVAFEGGRSSFGRLQQPSGPAEAVLCAFDLLHLLGHDTTGLPLGERRELLSRLLEGAASEIRLVPRLEGEAAGLLEEACRRGEEGLMAKRAGSPYRPGRSSDWRKLKCTSRQELAVGGWTDPSGTRKGLGSLLMGYYDESGMFRYAGKVGTGIDSRTLARLLELLAPAEAPASPFDEPVPPGGVHWVRPEVVAEVEFSEWTRAGRMRHPRFVGLRRDKAAASVRRETTGA